MLLRIDNLLKMGKVRTRKKLGSPEITNEKDAGALMRKRKSAARFAVCVAKTHLQRKCTHASEKKVLEIRTK